MISIDFETRSCTNLLTDGAYNYATDPTTDILCMAYAVDGGEPELWVPGMPVPGVFHGEHDAHTFYAWNATFERLIWDYILAPDYGFPAVPLQQWRCTAYMSRCSNMPNALGNAARCLHTPQQKQARGRELIKLLCVPLNSAGDFCDDEGLLWEMYDYCLDDVRTERAVARQLRTLTDEEWADYYANERINDRGVRIDRAVCQAAQVYAAEEEADLVARIEELTDGAVVKARGEKLKDWVVERLTKEQEHLLVKYRKGERKLSLDKYNRFRLLSLDDIDPGVREVVECSDFAQKSSVGKFRAMDRMADPDDDRVRGALWCNGASASGRASSKGLQVHNFPRDCMDNPLEVRADFVDQIIAQDITDYYKLPMMTILSRMLRPAIIPAPGHVFLDSDWSAIEGRVAPWLCNTPVAELKLDQYREHDSGQSDFDTYTTTAADTFRTHPMDITPDQRQVGKVQELSFQFGGGAKAFLGMARNYGVLASVQDAERFKESWRHGNPWAPRIWEAIEDAATAAIHRPGEVFTAGRLQYFAVGNILAGGMTLFCQLPCGRVLTYPDTRIEYKEAPWGDMVPTLTYLRAAFVPKADEKEWPRTALWGGLLFENAVQGTAASLLRWAVREAEQDGLDVVFHVHDQLVCEIWEKHAETGAACLRELMNDAPAWAEGLPVKADVDIVERFGK